MKKIVLLACLICLLETGWTQGLGTSIGVQGGISLLSQKIEGSGESKIFDNTPGYMFGLVLDQPIGRHFSFQSGLNYVLKGSEEREYYSTQSNITTIQLKYVELPISIIMKSGKNNAGLFAGIGASASYGIDAKIIYDPSNSISETKEYSFGNKKDNAFKPFDLGAYFQAGIEFRFGAVLSAHYYLGFSNILNSNYENADQTKLTNRYFGLKLGFLFNNR